MNNKTVIPDFSIDGFRQGRQIDFTLVYNLYYDRMYEFAYSLLKVMEAKDIVTESFVKLWDLREKFQSVDHIRNFLYLVTRNACIDYRRHLNRQRKFYKEMLYLEEDQIDDSMEANNVEILFELSLKIKSLPGKCRKIFELIYFENLGTSEVAKRMQVSNQNVLNQKARAISILRSSLLTAEM
jgi:RNA polymerase sigma-70 factor (ECF subfamily)